MITHTTQTQRRKNRIRGKIRGTDNRPRLTIFRSNSKIYAQVINDAKGITLTAASSKKTTNDASLLGAQIAEKCLKTGIKTIVFDRGPYKYHGRIKAIAESARKGGLIF